MDTRELSATNVAGRTGLEPAASGVTGRRYNQLNYRPNGERLTSMVPRRYKRIHYGAVLSFRAAGKPGVVLRRNFTCVCYSLNLPCRT